MINERIEEGKYEETKDSTLKELEYIQSFLYSHFQDMPWYKQTLPSSYQPIRLFCSSKTPKFDGFIVKPTIEQTGTCYYKTGKVIFKIFITVHK